MNKKLIVGLGNPGKEYHRTRHNLGFWVLDLLAEKFEARWNKIHCKAQTTQAQYASWSLTLAKPNTFMNLSGESVQCLFHKISLTPSDLMVICDDVNLQLGILRIRKEGSAGGHHGLESIIASIGSNQFARIRLGVKPLEENLPDDLSGFVLERFRKGEEAVAAEAVRRAVDAFCVIMDDGLDAAMNQHNRKSGEEQ